MKTARLERTGYGMKGVINSNIRGCCLVLCLVFAGAVWPVQVYGGGVVITVKADSLVSGEEILLKDVAVIEADGLEAQALGNIGLGNSPKPGKIKYVDKDRLVRIVQSSRIFPEKAQIVCPDRVYVKRAGQTLDREVVVSRVEELLKDRFMNRTVEIEELSIRGDETYPVGALDLDAESRDPVDGHGRLSLSMDVLVEGKRQGSIRIRGMVSEYVDVVCARRDLAKDVTLSERDLTLKRINLFDFKDLPLKEMDRAVGKLLKTPARSGDPIDPSMFKNLPLVEKGEMVTMIAKKDYLHIRTMGIAKEDGYENQLVAVENISSGKVIRGVVRDGTTVEIVY